MKVCAVLMLALYLCLGALAAYFGFSAKHSSKTRVSGYFEPYMIIFTAVSLFLLLKS